MRAIWAVKEAQELVNHSVGRAKSEAITRFMTPLRLLDGEQATWDQIRVDRGLEVVQVRLIEVVRGRVDG